ncbi:hypothetical protein BGY98DRAFT_936980 [Russula aff. rugulosa BPL654]|nr:hypothetical protein BGY98DRAFT_936980 [Russula aff. rugulosa BPL654]
MVVKSETIYATMQPPVPPAASTGADGAGSASGVLEVMVKRSTKKSIWLFYTLLLYLDNGERQADHSLYNSEAGLLIRKPRKAGQREVDEEHQNPTISVRAGEGILGEVKVTRSPVSPTDKTQHNNDSEHNVNNHLDISVLPQFWGINDPFNVRESILARPHTEIGHWKKDNNKNRVGLLLFMLSVVE